MILTIKKKIFPYDGYYEVYDQAGYLVYKATLRSGVGEQKTLLDANNNEVAILKRKVLSFMPKFDICINGQVAGTILKKVSPLHPTYTLDTKGWTMVGNYPEWRFNVTDAAGNLVVVIRWDPNILRTYTIDTAYDSDALFAVLLMLAFNMVEDHKEEENTHS